MQEKAEIFWNWFEKNHHGYLFLTEVEADERERLLLLLKDKLEEYCEHLFFELKGGTNGIQELTFSADGNIDYFDHVKVLFEYAPKLPDWCFFAFKQAYEGDFTVEVDDISLMKSQIWFTPLETEDKNELNICVHTLVYDQLKDNDWYEIMIYKILEIVLGELSFSLGIEKVEYKQVIVGQENRLLPLSELPAFVMWYHTQNLNPDDEE